MKLSSILFHFLLILHRINPFKRAFCKLLKLLNFPNEKIYKDINFYGKFKVNLDENNSGFAIDFIRVCKSHSNLYHHIGIYIYKPNILKKFVELPQSLREKERKLEQMRAMDNNFRIKLVKVSHNPPSVDTIKDLQKIRLHFKKNNL
mgnify:CR=1 FL=1